MHNILIFCILFSRFLTTLCCCSIYILKVNFWILQTKMEDEIWSAENYRKIHKIKNYFNSMKKLYIIKIFIFVYKFILIEWKYILISYKYIFLDTKLFWWNKRIFWYHINIMRVPKRPIVFQFKNQKRKTNFKCPNHSFSKIKMKMKNKIDRSHCQLFWIIRDDTFMTSTTERDGRVLKIIMCLWILLFL